MTNLVECPSCKRMVSASSLVLVAVPTLPELQPIIRVCPECVEKVRKEVERQEIEKLEKDYHPEDWEEE